MLVQDIVRGLNKFCQKISKYLKKYISKFRVGLFVYSRPSDDLLDPFGAAVGLCAAEVLLFDLNINSVHEDNSVANEACGVDEMVADLARGEQSNLKYT